jgi:peptidoglycan hydrolase-like protein with peptidoglycan-binding domain
MKKIVRLTESDLTRIVERVLNEQFLAQAQAPSPTQNLIGAQGAPKNFQNITPTQKNAAKPAQIKPGPNVTKAVELMRKGIMGPGGFGTDENSIALAFQQLKNVNDFNFFKAGLVKTGLAKTVSGAINGELGSDDLSTVQSIKRELDRLGIKSTFRTNGTNYVENSFKITGIPTQQPKTQAPKTSAPKTQQTATQQTATQQTATQQTATQQTAAPSIENVNAKRAVMRMGMTGDSVKQVQQMLAKHGYFKAQPTNNFGKITDQAVKAFQTAKNLKADGIVGDATLKLLQGPVASQEELAKIDPRKLQPIQTTQQQLQVPQQLQIPQQQTVAQSGTGEEAVSRRELRQRSRQR